MFLKDLVIDWVSNTGLPNDHLFIVETMFPIIKVSDSNLSVIFMLLIF